MRKGSHTIQLRREIVAREQERETHLQLKDLAWLRLAPGLAAQSLRNTHGTRSLSGDTKASSAGAIPDSPGSEFGPAQMTTAAQMPTGGARPHKNPTLGSAPRLLFRSAKDFWPPAVFFGRDSRRFSGRRGARRPAVIRAHPWAWPTALGGALWGNGARVGGRRSGAIFDLAEAV